MEHHSNPLFLLEIRRMLKFIKINGTDAVTLSREDLTHNNMNLVRRGINKPTRNKFISRMPVPLEELILNHRRKLGCITIDKDALNKMMRQCHD